MLGNSHRKLIYAHPPLLGALLSPFTLLESTPRQKCAQNCNYQVDNLEYIRSVQERKAENGSEYSSTQTDC